MAVYPEQPSLMTFQERLEFYDTLHGVHKTTDDTNAAQDYVHICTVRCVRKRHAITQLENTKREFFDAMNWVTPFEDTNYTVIATLVDENVHHASLSATVENLTAVGCTVHAQLSKDAQTGDIVCVHMHAHHDY